MLQNWGDIVDLCAKDRATGHGALIAVKGKGTVAIEGHSGLKLISDVLYVPEIN